MARRNPDFASGEAGAEATQQESSWVMQADVKAVAIRRRQNRFSNHERYKPEGQFIE